MGIGARCGFSAFCAWISVSKTGFRSSRAAPLGGVPRVVVVALRG
jgi:hypothetical protein